MNKKTFFVILFAAILALAVSLLFFDRPKVKPVEEPKTPEPVQIETFVPETPKTKEETSETKSAPAKPVKKVQKVSYKKPAAPQKLAPDPPVVTAEPKKPAEPEAAAIEEEKDVIIPVEYKMKSPAKYSFK